MSRHLFDHEWKKYKSADEGSWKSEVIENINGHGEIYLHCLSKWYEDFPGTQKSKNHLKASIKSPLNTDHLGAVNELSWWKFWNSRGFNIKPIPVRKNATPDFMLQLNEKESVFFEVTTLNPSKDARCREINFSRENSIRRIIKKAASEKLAQYNFGVKRNSSSILVLFNYDEWVGFGIPFTELKKDLKFSSLLPNDLSGIIYIERSVKNGRVYFKKDSIDMIENPSSDLPLSVEFRSTFKSILNKEKDWIACELPNGILGKSV